MKVRARRVAAFVVPFLVGGVAAVAVETSAALLLYVGRGLLSALSLVIAVDLAALSVGLWVGGSAGGSAGAGGPEALRRRWLGALLAYAAAAVLAAGWMMYRDLRTSSAGRALGLAVLGAWPLYALGALLAALGAEAISGAGRGLGRARVAVAASAGAASGILVTGSVLIPALVPPSIYLVCVVVLSGGALLCSSLRGTGRGEPWRRGGAVAAGAAEEEPQQELERREAAEEEREQEPARKEAPQEAGDA